MPCHFMPRTKGKRVSDLTYHLQPCCSMVINLCERATEKGNKECTSSDSFFFKGLFFSERQVYIRMKGEPERERVFHFVVH